jgi:uncharacterized Zn-finger protein
VTITDYVEAVGLVDHARLKYEENIHGGKEGSMKCNECDKLYTNTNALQYHIKVKHEPSRGKYPCLHCGFEFTSEITMKRHERVIQGEGLEEVKYNCETCGLKFQRKDSLTRHEREIHYGSKVNFAYVEHVEDMDMETISCVKCKLCVKQYK